MTRNLLIRVLHGTKHLMSKSDEDNAKHEGECCHVFCQMDALRPFHNEFVWKEVRRKSRGRLPYQCTITIFSCKPVPGFLKHISNCDFPKPFDWVKFEEELEEDGKRWSKPHVSSLCMQYLTELHLIVASNPVLLDLDAGYMSEIVDILLEHWSSDGVLQPLLWNHVRSILLKTHKHQSLHKHIHSFHLPKIKSNTALVEEDEAEDGDILNGTTNKAYIPEVDSQESIDNSENNQKEGQVLSDGEMNKKFKRKIPAGSEVMNIMIGEIEDLRGNLCAFIRLRNARDIGMITEVDLPTRFLFILLVPNGNLEPALEAGRCMGTLITDEIFREIAYKAENYTDILSGIQEFTSQTTVLPPGCWNPATRIEPPESLPSKETRKAGMSFKDKEPKAHIDPTLQRTGRLFGGLVEDIKRKLPWYKSDFTDALHVQCIASFIYLYLATLTPNVTFGGMLGKATNDYMGPMECILAAAITGVAFALFSGQPLNILGSTGPMLVLEMILYKFCQDQHWDYMPFRCWVGLWIALLIFIIVAFDLSALVRYITRFTEECFACLIALIFIYQAFENLIKLEHEFPVEFHAPVNQNETCMCTLPNTSIVLNRYVERNQNESSSNFGFPTLSTSENLHLEDGNGSIQQIILANCSAYGGVLTGRGCDVTKYVPDVFFLSILLFLGTFGIAIALVNVKGGRFATSAVRQTISDFGVLLAIVIMVFVDALLGIPTPKLSVPTEFKPSNPDRGWFISPISDRNPWWLMLAASLPAMLTTILVFMDQQITAVIVNRQQHKLQKGSGYHLDMLVLGVLIIILSLFGLPWYVAATVSALAHILSLKRESGCTAPGEKPQFLGVREQRVTALLVGILSGFSILITSVLKYIPMPVLYGVFLYMGVAALNGMQLVQRISILFMPQKYQPDYKYLRHVPIKKVHLFTGIQLMCLIVLWVIKSIKKISIIFPLMVLATIFVRKGLDIIFTEHELRWLDGSGNARERKKLKQKKAEIQEVEEEPEPPVPKTKAEKRQSVALSMKQRCISLPASVNVTYQPTVTNVNETAAPTTISPSADNQETFDKRSRKISLMALPSENSYRRESEHMINKDFQLSMSTLHQALSQENIDGVKHQEIFGRRKSRRPSLLAIPPVPQNQSSHL